MREEAVLIDRAQALAGVVTHPDDSKVDPDLPGVILLNIGLLHRVGPNRIYVKLARRLAAQGFVVLRFDFTGIGDSNSSTDSRPFQERWLDETGDVMEWLAETRGTQRFITVGICEGGVSSFNTARSDPRVVGAAVINPHFHDDAIDSYVWARRFWRAALLNPRSWIKPLTGRVNYRKIKKALLKGTLTSASQAKATESELGIDLRAIVDRGAKLLLVYRIWHPGLGYLDFILGKDREPLIESGKLQLEVIEGTDNLFTPLMAQERLIQAIEQWAPTVAKEPVREPAGV